ncbi:MAG: deoxyribose-phosphate aldolase [Gammaproteobacteria bacterium]|jgi:deoxyribose-phosphate aldolase|nr:deoxyribose-phosphate aldolase [Gammaproteobacteria bacterium]
MKNSQELAAFIDHTLLKPQSTSAMVEQLCEEAIQHKFCSVCVLPTFVAKAAGLLKDSDVKVCTVIGFPLGATETRVKEVETEVAVEQGADEVDMVLNIGLLKSAEFVKLKNDIATVVEAAKGKTVKVILETCLLTDEEKKQACEICVEAGADFVKTSTGFSTSGATIEDVRLMRETVGPDIGVKASGGVRDYQTACAMIDAGATRLGTSSGMLIVEASNTRVEK